MALENIPVSRKENIVIQELNGELLIYDLNTHKAYCLNETSALVWQNCDGSKPVNHIADAVGKKLNQKVSEDFVWFAIEQMKEKELVVCNDNSSKFSGVSRREAIRKIGLSSLVTLPVISMLVAPTAAQAASGDATAICNVCSKKTATECAACGTQLGNCYDNSGCASSGLIASNVTCSTCSTLGTPGGQSWRGI